MMNGAFEIEVEISAGKKKFKVVSENAGYTLIESGSIVAVLKKNDQSWEFTTGSYNEHDAALIGSIIESHKTES
jgi:hypothetical protein